MTKALILSSVINYKTDSDDWLRLSKHLFDFPTTLDKETSRKFEAINFTNDNMLDEIEKLKKGTLLPFFQEIEKKLGNLPLIAPERYAKHTYYLTNPNALTNTKWKGKGPCNWKYDPIIAAVKDFLAAYHPNMEPYKTNPEPAWYWVDLVALFCVKMVEKDDRNVERLRNWTDEIRHSNFLSLLQYHSTEVKTNWYLTKNILKQKVSDIGLSTPENVTKKDIKSRFDTLDGVKPAPKFHFDKNPNFNKNWNFSTLQPEKPKKQPSKLQQHLDNHPNSRPSTALINEHLQNNLREAKEDFEAKQESTSVLSFDQMDPTKQVDSTEQPRILDQSTILHTNKYRDKFRANNSTLQEFDEFSKTVARRKTGLNRQTVIVSRDNQRDVQKTINENNRTHPNKFVTMRNLSFTWDDLSSNDSHDENVLDPNDPVSELLQMISTQPVDITLVKFVHQKCKERHFTVSQINHLVTNLLTGLSLEAIQVGCVPKILKYFPQYESLEFCVLQPNTHSTSANWKPEETKTYRNYYKIPHKFSKKITYEQVRRQRTFNLQMALQPYYDELISLKQEGKNPAILCKFFLETGIDDKLKRHITRHNLNINYKPSSFKYVIEKLYCLEASKILSKLDDKVAKFFAWNNKDRQTYKPYVDRFVRQHKRIINLMILQDRLNHIQRYHTPTYSPVDLATRYVVPMHLIITKFVAGIVHHKLRQNVVKRIRRDVHENNRLTGKLPKTENLSIFSDVVPTHLPRIPQGFRVIEYIANIVHHEGQKIAANNLRDTSVLGTITYSVNNKSTDTRNSKNFSRSNSFKRTPTRFPSNRGTRSRNSSRKRDRSFGRSRSRTPKKNFRPNKSRTPKKSILKNSNKKSVSFGKTPSWRKKSSNYNTNKKSYPKTKWMKPTYNDSKFKKLKSSNRHNSFKYNKEKHLKKSSNRTNIIQAEIKDDSSVNDDGSVVTEDIKTNLMVKFDSGDEQNDNNGTQQEQELPDVPSIPSEHSDSSMTADEPLEDDPQFDNDEESDDSDGTFEDPQFASDDNSESEEHFSCVIKPQTNQCTTAKNVIFSKDLPPSLRDPLFEKLPPNVVAYRKLCKELGSKHKVKRTEFIGKCPKCGSTSKRHRPNLCGKLKSILPKETGKNKCDVIQCSVINTIPKSASTSAPNLIPIVEIDTKEDDVEEVQSREEKVDDESHDESLLPLRAPTKSPSIIEQPSLSILATWKLHRLGSISKPLHIGKSQIPARMTTQFNKYTSLPLLPLARPPVCWKQTEDRRYPILFIDLGPCWTLARFCRDRLHSAYNLAFRLLSSAPMPSTHAELCKANLAILRVTMDLQYKSAWSQLYEMAPYTKATTNKPPFSLYPKFILEQMTRVDDPIIYLGVPPMFWYKAQNGNFEIFIDYYSINLLAYSTPLEPNDSNDDNRRINLFNIMSEKIDQQSINHPTCFDDALKANDHLWLHLKDVLALREASKDTSPPFVNKYTSQWDKYKIETIVPRLAKQSKFVVDGERCPTIFTMDPVFEAVQTTRKGNTPQTNLVHPSPSPQPEQKDDVVTSNFSHDRRLHDLQHATKELKEKMKASQDQINETTSLTCESLMKLQRLEKRLDHAVDHLKDMMEAVKKCQEHILSPNPNPNTPNRHIYTKKGNVIIHNKNICIHPHRNTQRFWNQALRNIHGPRPPFVRPNRPNVIGILRNRASPPLPCGYPRHMHNSQNRRT